MKITFKIRQGKKKSGSTSDSKIEISITTNKNNTPQKRAGEVN